MSQLNLSLAFLPALAAVFCAVYVAEAGEAPATLAAAVTLETEGFRLAVGRDGYNLSFTDKRTGKDYCGPEVRQPFAFFRKGGKVVLPTGCSAAGDLVTI
ncbi:MAG: hypothetical protein ABSE73_31925, partial [Planctomycetota bacterium]